MGYFDDLPQRIAVNEKARIFEKHIHWGYWETPETATTDLDEFCQAAENLSLELIKLSEIKDGQSILDAGCGFGGTLSLLNQQFRSLNLQGVNIDEAQIQYAQATIQPQAINNNTIELTCCDACQINFAPQSFDTIIALECIFAFPSREVFFNKSYNLLKTGGKLAIGDFLLAEPIAKLWQGLEKTLINPMVAKSYGKKASPRFQFWSLSDYQKLAEKSGFKVIHRKNINKNVQPTYRVVNPIISEGKMNRLVAAKGLELISYLEMMRYELLVLEKQDQ